MQKNKLYIHVGMPRTGTTFLQHKIFPYLKGYEYFHNSECLLLLNHFKKVIFSSESLSYNRYRKEIIKRLKSLYPNANIIIGLREKEDLKSSLYRHSLSSGYYCKSFKEYIHERRFLFEGLNDYLEYIKKTFKNIYIYEFEDFKKDNRKIVNELCSFMDAKVPYFDTKIINKSFPESHIERFRWVNSFFSKRSRFMNPLYHLNVYLNGEGHSYVKQKNEFKDKNDI